jgi:hypothetical protein
MRKCKYQEIEPGRSSLNLYKGTAIASLNLFSGSESACSHCWNRFDLGTKAAAALRSQISRFMVD